MFYYVLPLVRGESLRDRLNREKQLSLDEALAITQQIAGALDYAHRQGVVHRDIKPENILFQEGEAMLADFGIALAVKEAGGHRLTETGLSLGTPQYMSPEQATGDRQLDGRTDVYSLAAVLSEMLAGEPPVTGPNAQAMIARLLTERPPRLRTVRESVPDAVDDAVARALAKVPADRFAGAGEFARALSARVPDRSAGVRVTGRLLRVAGALLVVAAPGFLAWSVVARTLALAYQKRGMMEEAGASYREAIEADPRYPTARQWYATYLAMLGRTAEGVEQIQVAARLDPLSLVILIEVGELLQAVGRDDEATAAYEPVLALYPDTYLVNYFVGIHFLQRADYARSAGMLSGFMALWSGDSVQARRLRGAILDPRIRDSVLRIVADSSSRPELSSAIHLLHGDEDAAIAALERAVASPDFEHIYLPHSLAVLGPERTARPRTQAAIQRFFERLREHYGP